MPGFLYFLTGLEGVQSPESLDKQGLGYAFPEGTGLHNRDVKGPEGNKGVMVANAANLEPGDMKYDPEKQWWGPLPKSQHFFGYYLDRLPTGEDLERPDPLSGFLRMLGERTWLCPAARFWQPSEDEGELIAGTNLPLAEGMDKDGNWYAGEIPHKYQTLWESALWWAEVRGLLEPEGEGRRVTDKWLIDQGLLDKARTAAALALTTNYRIGPGEITVLRLLDQHTRPVILDCLADEPTRQLWLQKKRAKDLIDDGSTSASGNEDSTEPTDQQ